MRSSHVRSGQVRSGQVGLGFRLDQALAKIIDQLDNIIDELEKEEEEDE